MASEGAFLSDVTYQYIQSVLLTSERYNSSGMSDPFTHSDSLEDSVLDNQV